MQSLPLQRTSRWKNRAGWLALVCAVSSILGEQITGSLNPAGIHSPWPSVVPRPLSFDVAVWWRNLSFLLSLILGFYSLPRWQSIIALALALVYGGYSYFLFASY